MRMGSKQKEVNSLIYISYLDLWKADTSWLCIGYGTSQKLYGRKNAQGIV
jgi:hypothetical protein